MFTEESGVVGNNYAVCLRKTDGSPVVRLGEGTASDLSPDGKWALAQIPGTHQPLMIYPTGPGESRRLDPGTIETYHSAKWFRDGERVLVCGAEAGRAPRCYVQDVRGSAPRAVTPENTGGGLVSPDGHQVLVRHGGSGGRFDTSGATVEIYPVAGGEPRTVSGLTKDDAVIRWESDGQALLISHGKLPARIERLSLDTGRRDLVRVLAPGSMVGATGISNITAADDPNVYAYVINQQLSRLFMVQGAR